MMDSAHTPTLLDVPGIEPAPVASTMVTSLDATVLCEVCDGEVGPGRHVHFEAWLVSVYCSADCSHAALLERRRALWATRARQAKWLLIATILFAGWLAPHARPVHGSALLAHRPVAPPPVEPGPDVLPPGWFGPEWPPSEQSVLATLGRDAWVHPLAGPVRRMPRLDSRVFGAVRPGERPGECRNGHCGVDLGGEIWGEHVHAVHDGMVDFVQRGPNPDRGGSFVRIVHREGLLYSWYFHLAAIPRGIERGTYVHSGDVIGLLGDTGVKNSAPHLHFAMTIRTVKDGPERYIDPEPLVALWPLWVPVDGSEVGLVTTIAEPGVPLGSATLRPGHGRRVAAKTAKRPGRDTTPDSESGAEDDATASGTAGGEGETEPAPAAASDSSSDTPTEE